MQAKTHSGGKRLLAGVTAALVAAGGLLLAPTASYAAEETIGSGELSWGIREQWRNYIGLGPGQPGPGAVGTIEVTGEPATVDANYFTTWKDGEGTVDVDAGTGEIQYRGEMTLTGHYAEFYPNGWGMRQTYKDPKIELTSPTTATLSFEMTQVSILRTWPALPSEGLEGPRYDLVDLEFAAADLADGNVTTTSAKLTETGARIWANYGAYVPGVEMDPVTFSFQLVPDPTETQTTVSVDPVESDMGEAVTFTATVTPEEAEGTVQFEVNGAAKGDPVEVTGGTASYTASDLEAGNHSVSATFTPASLEAFTESTAAAVDFTVTDPATRNTETTLSFFTGAAQDNGEAPSPVTFAESGEEVTLSAKVTAVSGGAVEGSVEFFVTAVGQDEASLAVVEVENGEAVFKTTELEPGLNTVNAKFTPQGNLNPSESGVKKFRVVDTAQPALCEVDVDAAEKLTGVSATWSWNEYSSGWDKVASGNVSVDDQNFVLTEGEATVSDSCTRIAFEGTLRTEAYKGFFMPNGQWVELVNPELVIDAEGKGAWVAAVRSGAGELNEDTSERMVVAEVADSGGLDFTQNDVNASVAFKFDDTTASGTWRDDQTGAWPNGFILQTPSAIRSFYYASGASGDPTKPAANLEVKWQFDAAAEAHKVVINDTEGVEVPENKVKQGEDVVFVGSKFRAGDNVKVEVFSDPQDLGTVVADSDGAATKNWTVPADFPAGEHTVKFTSESTGAEAKTTMTVEEVPAEEEPGTEEPGDEPGTEEPGTKEPGTKEPGAEKPVAEKPAQDARAVDAGKGGLANTGAELPAVASILAMLSLFAGAGLLVARRRKDAVQ